MDCDRHVGNVERGLIGCGTERNQSPIWGSNNSVLSLPLLAHYSEIYMSDHPTLTMDALNMCLLDAFFLLFCLEIVSGSLTKAD